MKLHNWTSNKFVWIKISTILITINCIVFLYYANLITCISILTNIASPCNKNSSAMFIYVSVK